MVMDGAALMQPYDHFEWTCHALFMVNRFILRQLPSQYRVSMDAERFLHSLSMSINGERRSPRSWDLAPDAPVHEPGKPFLQYVPL